MIVIGLTGSIGMGKTTAAARFGERGVPVCDADAEVHRLYNGAAVAPIEAAFPGTTVNGRVDRQRLAEVLLGDHDDFKRLEAIVHPLVQAAERDFLRVESRRGARLAVLEIPLLFETGADARVDVTVVVSAPLDVQRARVLARPGMTAEKLDAVLARQLADSEKRRRADFIVDTGQSGAATQARIDHIIAELSSRPAGTAYRRFWA